MEDWKTKFYCDLGKKFAKSRRKGSNTTVNEAVQKKRCKNGNDFEKLVLNEFFENGFWVWKLKNESGTPFDLMSVKKGLAFGIECKHLDKMPKTFRISQLRDNQLIGLDNFTNYGESFVVFGNDDDIRVIDFKQLAEMGKMPVSDGTPLELFFKLVRASQNLKRKDLERSINDGNHS